MENASKALLMAAGVLIGLLILTLGVYLFATFGESVSETKKQLEEKSISQFNTRFLSYSGRTNLTIYDLIELANIAQENNSWYDLNKLNAGNPSTMYVQVRASLGGTWENNLEQCNENEKNNFIKDELNNITYDLTTNTATKLREYTCNASISPTTGRVYLVVIQPT